VKPTISVIIPTLDEEQTLQQTLSRLVDEENIEIIVVDGGSKDASMAMAKARGALVISSPRGRGVQLNQGVKVASGKLLLFLHADTRLPDNFAFLIRRTLSRKNCGAGAFSLQIDSSQMSLAIIAYFANLRSRLLQMPYGDQGIFTTRNAYNRIGGFAEVAIMEDFIFIKNMRKYGEIHILDETVVTSSRRWQNRGIILTTLTNQFIILGYYCGVKLPILAHWYQRLEGVRKK